MIHIGARETISPIFAAALRIPCPWCHAIPGVECRQRSGRLVWPPHEKRVMKCRPSLLPVRAAAASRRTPLRPFAVDGRFVYGEWQPLGRDERSRTLPGRRGSAGNVAVLRASASARQVPRVPRLFAVITGLVLLFFGCVR